jgi:hypothetical protein
MSAGRRALVALLITAAGTAGVVRTARAETPQQRADKLNNDGKKLLFATPPDYQGAADKFRQAIVMSSEGRFYFNLCLAEYSMGDFGNALMACQAVGGNAAPADDHTKKNASDLLDKIKEQMRQQGMDPNAVGTTTGNPNTGNPNTGNPNTGNPDNTTGNPNTGNPNTGNPNTGNPNTGNPNTGNPLPPPGPSQFRGAPPPSLFAQTPPSHDYTYTIGAAVIGGGGAIGTEGAYSSSIGGLRIVGDYMLAQPQKIGAEGYADFLQVGDNGMPTNIGSMSVVDVGLGLYKHFCSGRLCVTPMAGAQVVLYAPSSNPDTSQDFAALGLRLQGSIGYALGSHYEHYLSLSFGGDFDSKPVGSYSVDPSGVGLDRGAAVFLVSLGYQYRFNTPFGQSPFFQLE